MASPELAIALFLLTVSVVIWRPKQLSIGWIATGGALMALLLHVVSFANIWTVTCLGRDLDLCGHYNYLAHFRPDRIF